MVPRSKISGGVIVRTFHSKVGVRKRSAVFRQDRYRNTGIATPAHDHPLASICYPRIVNPLSTPPQQVLCHCCTGAKDPAPDILHPICLPLECSLLPLAFITSKYVFSPATEDDQTVRATFIVAFTLRLLACIVCIQYFQCYRNSSPIIFS